jgi:histidyl-tRNA synthetase
MIRCCHGFTDWSPRDMALFRKVEQLFLDTMESWSYNEIRTPTVEYLYLFTSAGTLTPGKLRRTYSFLDWDGWSGERVVLKPDATIPVARMYTENTSSRQTVRYSYVTNTFMFDDTGKKSRERWQCGAELIGTGASIADGELMSIILELMNRLNIPDFRLRLSHSGLISLLLKKAGLNTEESNQIFDELLDGNEQAFMRIEQANPELAHIFAMMLGMNGKTPGFLKNLKALLKKVISGDEAVIDDFIAVTEIAQAIGIPFEINLAAAKGYEYYTGIIFHVMSGSEVIAAEGDMMI